MTRLQDLYAQQDQSPWLDNLKRGWITSGELRALGGARASAASPRTPRSSRRPSRATPTTTSSCATWWPTAPRSTTPTGTWSPPTSVTPCASCGRSTTSPTGIDGFVSVEVAPSLARDTDGTVAAARHLHADHRRSQPLREDPRHGRGRAGHPADDRRGSQHQRDAAVLASSATARSSRPTCPGLEACAGDLSGVSSVAVFFVSRVDTEVDHRLEQIGSDEALALRGKAAVANAKLAYQLFLERFSGPRWEALAARGARVQRPLWASTSTKNPAYPRHALHR